MITNNSMGFDFVWWVGVVEDRHDPMYLGRCKVRCLGWHTEDKELIPTYELPWAYPLMPITSASQTGVGQSPLGPVEGTWVMGFFRDGKDAQEPVMMGTLHGVPDLDIRSVYTKTKGFHDPRAFDGVIDSDVHPFSLDALKLNIRSLLDGASTRQEDKVPREPEDLEFSATGDSVRITEQEQKSPFPDYHYSLEPTTNRLARGLADPTSQLKTTDDGKIKESSKSILKRKRDSRQAGQIRVPTGGDFGSKLKQIAQFSPGGGLPQSSKFVEPNVRPTIRSFSEPISPYNANYPYNHVTQTESGHVIEFDDTPEFERIHLYHRAGSFAEWHPDGKVVFKSASDMYSINHGNYFSHVEGQKLETVDSGYQLFVNKDGKSIDSNYSIKIGTGGSYYANVENGNYYISATGGTLESNTSVFQIGTTSGSEIKGSENLNIFSPQNVFIDTDGDTQIQSQNMELRSEGKVDLTGVSGGINIHSELGAIDISTTSIPAIGGIRLHTGASPINIVADEVTQGGAGMINLLLGLTGAMGAFSIKPGFTEIFTPGIGSFSANVLSLNSSSPISISAGTGSLKSVLFDIIDEIQKITVPTGTGNSGTPLNTAGFATLKTKILGFTI